MADFGEGLPFDAVTDSGSAQLLHNAWPGLWAETVQEGCRRAGRPACVAWFRSGSLGMAEHAPLFWNGPQLVDLGRSDGLASALLGTFSAGVSGWPLVHSDLGGYTSVNAVVRDYVRSEEILARWGEAAAFGVVVRTHEGNRPDRNVQVADTPATRAAFTRATRIFTALSGYRAQVLAEAERDGLPALRHGWLVAPGTAAARTDRQFFLGDAVLMAPVLAEGEDGVDVTLPPGRWRHLVTGEVHEGETTQRVAAPVGTPAAFIRADHPMADDLVAAVGRAATEAAR
jgi:alpha-glucosidase